MKRIFTYFAEFYSETKHPLFWGLWICFLVMLFVLRFGFGFDMYFTGFSYGLLLKSLMYPGIVWAVLGMMHVTGFHPIPVGKSFWLSFVGLMLILTFNHYFNFFQASWLDVPLSTHYFYNKVLFNAHAIFWYFVPSLIWFLWDTPLRKQPIRLKFDAPNLIPYFGLLAALLPLLYVASFDAGFQKSYPRYRPGIIETYYSWPYWKTVGAFELTYALQFIGVEWFFRGFFLMVMSRFLGVKSIFLMATAYGFMHFGKPMPEAITSVIGGLALGVLSWKSKSITGGIIVHLGIGLAMEFFAFLNAG